MHDPRILILDEPTSGLDPLMQNRFIDLINEEKKKGKTILISSHMFDEVERTCHRVGIIKNGRIVTIDSVEQLKVKQLKKYIVSFSDDVSLNNFLKEDLDIIKYDNYSVLVTVSDNLSKFISTLDKYPVSTLSAPSLSLEEVFMQYYGEKSD